MKDISEIFVNRQDLRYIAEIFTLNSGGIATICGNRISNEKVWIKVVGIEVRRAQP